MKSLTGTNPLIHFWSLLPLSPMSRLQMTPLPELARTTKDQPKPGSAEPRWKETQAVDDKFVGELGWTPLKEGLFIYPISH